jgi:hypothetical protein
MTQDIASFHMLQQKDTSLGNTHPGRCWYTCYRLNINSCELIPEKARYILITTVRAISAWIGVLECVLCFGRLPADGTLVPKHVGSDTYHEIDFVMGILLNASVGRYVEHCTASFASSVTFRVIHLQFCHYNLCSFM